MAIVILRPSGKGLDSIIYPGADPFPAAPNWGNVDEEVSDDFTSYNKHSGTGSFENPYSYVKVDNFTFPSFVLQNPTLVAIRLLCRRTSGAGVAIPQLVFAPYFEFFGTAVPFVGTNQWTEGYASWATNPRTGLPWTTADINALQAGYRLAIGGASSGVAETVYCTKFQVEVTVPQRYFFKDGSPEAGTSFKFFDMADQALASYITTANANGDMASLTAYLNSIPVTLRTGRFDRDPDLHETAHRFPLIYVATTLVTTLTLEPRTQAGLFQSSLRIWTSKGDPDEAKEQNNSVRSAIVSLLGQIERDASNTDFGEHYANGPHQLSESIQALPSIIETNREGRYKGRVRSEVLYRWVHTEGLG